MGALIGSLSIVLFLVFLVWLLIRIIRRKPKKQPALGMLICFIMIVVGFILSPDSDNEQPDDAEPSHRQSVGDVQVDPTVAGDPTVAEPSDEEDTGGEEDEEREAFKKTLTTGSVTFYENVRNDVTGRWRLLVYYSSENIVDHAVGYYNAYFESDDEVHIVVNLGLETTSVINVYSGFMQIDVHEYVDKEEHDAKTLGGGTLLKSYTVDLSTGEIEDL